MIPPVWVTVAVVVGVIGAAATAWAATLWAATHTVRRIRTAIRRHRLRDFPELQPYAEHVTIRGRR